MARQARQLARFHKVLGLVVGAQLILWTVSGFYFTLFPIDQIRGDHLRAEITGMAMGEPGLTLVPVEQVAARGAGLTEQVKLKPFVTGPAYEVRASHGISLYDAQTGQRISPLGEELARKVAVQNWAGRGSLTALTLYETPPREASGGGRPAWRADFDGAQKATFWIDAHTGDVRAVRTTKWRIFDFLWGLHIMDWFERDNFNTWWMKLFSFGAITMALTGAGLLIDRARKGRLLG